MGTIKNWKLLLNYNDVNLQIKLDFRNDVTTFINIGALSRDVGVFC